MSLTGFDPRDFALSQDEKETMEKQNLLPPGPLVLRVTFASVSPVAGKMRVGNKPKDLDPGAMDPRPEMEFFKEDQTLLLAGFGVVVDTDTGMNDESKLTGYSRMSTMNYKVFNPLALDGGIKSLPSNLQAIHYQNMGHLSSILTALGVENAADNPLGALIAHGESLKGKLFSASVRHNEWNDRVFQNFSSFRPLPS